MEQDTQTAGPREWTDLAVLALPTLLVSMDMTILYLAAPSLSIALRPTGAELLWISDIYGFFVACALIPMGALGDRVGRRRLLLIGSVMFGLASTLAACATSAPMLIGARALMGLAGATLLPSTLAMIRNLFAVPRQRSIAIGLWTACFTLGGVLGPLAGGLLLEHFWWGSVFLLALPVMLVLLVLGPLLLPEFRDAAVHPVDLPSVAHAMVAVLAITFSMKHAAEQGLTLAAAASLLLGLAAAVAFARRQRRLVHPLIDLALFRNPSFAAAIGANSLALFAWVGASFLVAQYLQLVVGMSPFTAGLWLLPSAMACVAGCLAAPVLSRLLSSGRAVGQALFLTAAGLAMLAVGTERFGLVAVIAGMSALGFGVSVVVTLGTDVVLSAAPPAKAGAASAISETGADIGGSLGVAVLGSIGVALYRDSLELPTGITPTQGASARDTLGAAVELAAGLPDAAGASLLGSARDAFTEGLQMAAGAGSMAMLSMTVFFAWIVLRRPAKAS